MPHRSKRGWYCKFPPGHGGPCGLIPRWWNLITRWKYRRNI